MLAVVGSSFAFVPQLHCTASAIRHESGPSRTPRCRRVLCWTGESVAKYEISGVPIPYLYEQYADLTRMTEWSPSLESVSIDPQQPSHSLWVMRVPRALQAASRTVGYPEPNIQWEAVLDAPAPPLMTWTSKIRDDGSHQNAGFVPSGAVGFAPTSTPGTCEMSLTLSYTLQDPVEWWLLAIINSAFVQGIVRNRMRAGMVRFGKTVSAEYAAGAQRELDDAHGRVISSGSPSASTTSAESTL